MNARRWASLVLLAALGCRSEPPARLDPSPVGERGARSPAEIRRDGNHLVDEPSPYLQQHGHNPVDWYPWGEEAHARARRLNRPIFLSIGYSTCHWCHVMEEESFEDDEIAAFLNRHFVSIKVDREQRPDVDALYIDAVAAMGSSTGWPLTVFLTPDLEPFFGGTYFPPRARGGRPGFRELLEEVRRRFAEEGPEVAAHGREVLSRIERAVASPVGSTPLTGAVIDGALARLARARDPERGGFGRRQKFPNAPLLLAELRSVERSGDPASRAHLLLTLDEAMRGGIRDHLGGTFHRYAVDREWHVPHFEKTLYDNAQLALVYLEAGLRFGEPRFVAVGRAILDDLIAGWQRADGGLVVGFDADDAGGEGAYYTWTPAELTAALGEEDGGRAAELFGVTAQGDRELRGRSVLHRLPDDRVRERLGWSPAEADAFVGRIRPTLIAVRARRPAPAVDDKELTAWNGLALMSLSLAARWLDEPRYRAAAQRVGRFLVERGVGDGGTVLRGRRDGASLGEGFLDDHALAALGLVRLHAADGDPRWLLAAKDRADRIERRFYDPGARAFFNTARADDPDGLPLRRPDLEDGVLPGGGSAAMLALLEVASLAGDPERHQLARRAASRAASAAMERPFSSGFLLVVLDQLVTPTREVVLAGDPADPTYDQLTSVLRPASDGRVVLARLPAHGAAESLTAAFGALRGKTAIDGAPTAYVCELGRCELPTGDPATLTRQLAPVLAAVATPQRSE